MTRTDRSTIVDLIIGPIRDLNFRKLLVFNALWSFAANMAGPFFIIYMLQRIKISMSMVTLLTVVANSRFCCSCASGHHGRPVLQQIGPVGQRVDVLREHPGLVFHDHAGTLLPDRPAAVCRQHLGGIAVAGVNISTAGIALKLSPRDKAHSYMTVVGLAAALAGACGPPVGGHWPISSPPGNSGLRSTGRSRRTGSRCLPSI